jgi:ribosomal protein S18 acetylase RimI-like enzyme
MKIKILKKETKELKKFRRKEWKQVDLEHFGKNVLFHRRKYQLMAIDNKNEIIGQLLFNIMAGVSHIKEILVAKGRRRQNIGKELMRKAEEITRKHNIHKIILETGKTWSAVPFYKSLGYKITGKHPNHYFHQDFVIFTKFLK